MDGLLASLQSKANYLNEADSARLADAYELAREAHKDMRRKSGEPYITHPVAVTALLAELQLDADALIAGLLHDTVEDTAVTFEEIEDRFGEHVRNIVEGETKISKIKVRAFEDEQSENLRQMLVATARDVRIILVKLADRLHNMRTLASMPPEKQSRISRETLEIFAPLAHRLGIGHIKNELEDLAFMYLEPERYRMLERQVRMRHVERESFLKGSIALLRERLETEGLRFEVSGRSKHLYSIHRKMIRDGKNLDQIFDLMAIRAIIDPQNGSDLSQEDQEKAVCYRALGIVHSLWTPIPGRFKDYIAVPKPNDYQSLHTTVIGLQGQPIEVQIRTRRMHRVAEFGVAAHWAYKAGVQDPGEVRRRLNWMEQLLDVNADSEDAGAFVEAVKTDMLSERVLVFSPAGDVYNLPRGSTPIDFAYYVHTQVGHRCIGARVNGEIVPLGYELKTGDRVEILTNRSSQYGPSSDWLNLAATRSAKQKIKQYFRQQERQGQLESGRKTLERALRRRHLAISTHGSKARLEEAAEKLLHSDSVEDLYIALASKRLQPKQVLEILAPDSFPAKAGGVVPLPSAPSRPRSISGVYVDGLDMPANLAQCCSPVRGDDVIGYVTRGRGVSVHRIDCPNVRHLRIVEPSRFVNVSWDTPSGEFFPVDFEIIGVDRPGLLQDILAVIAGMNKSASRVTADVQNATSARIHFRIDVRDLSEIQHVRDNVLRIADVTQIYRSRPGLKA